MHRILKSATRAAGAALAVAAIGCNGPETNVNVIEPAMAVFPDALEFGEVAVDYDSTLEVTITNTSRAPLTVDSISVGGEYPGVFAIDPTAFELGEDESQTVQVTMTPDTYIAYTETLSIVSDDPDWDPAYYIPITGEGVKAPTPDIEVDPITLDFQYPEAGEQELLWFDLDNVGDAPLEIGETVQSGSGAFQIESDPSGKTYGEDDGTSVVVSYLADGTGHSGTLEIPSNDPDEPSTTVYFIGNGGSDLEYPVAVIDAESTSAPRATIALDGTGSYDPNGYEIVSHEWTLSKYPDGSSAALQGSQDSLASLYVDVAGSYQVQLQVTNEIELKSAPAKWDIEVIPGDDIHIYMAWNTGNTDVDLHLLDGDSAVIFETPADCCYCNPNPDWGTSSSDDDPRLDIDDQIGYGPENINVESPADGQYFVRVHYFEDAGEGASEVTLVMYLNGEKWPDTYKRTMYRNEVWDVGYIDWPNATFIEDNADPYEIKERGCQ